MFTLSSTIIRSFWLAVLLALFGLGSSIAASPLSPALTLFGYDAQSQASVAYDVGFRSIFGYDSAPVPIAGGEVNPTVGASNLFGEFGEFLAAEGTTALREGSFSIADWSGYPANVPKPTGPFNLLEGAEYDAARAEANAANRALHQADPSLNGLQLHEIQPVKFGGSPTDPLNKIPLTPQQHAPVTTWWNQLQRNITP